jgi:hypothetical protein
MRIFQCKDPQTPTLSLRRVVEWAGNLMRLSWCLLVVEMPVWDAKRAQYTRLSDHGEATPDSMSDVFDRL